LTQQLEEMKTEMKEMPKLIKEQLQREQRHQQVHFCEMCSSDQPTGYCPPQLEEEVNYVGNQLRPGQFQGQYLGNSNQQRYLNNNNFQRGNNFGQPWRSNARPSNQQPFNNNFQQYLPQQDRTKKLEDTLNQFMQLTMANQQNNTASKKNLETQMGQQAQHLSQISQILVGPTNKEGPSQQILKTIPTMARMNNVKPLQQEAAK